MIFDCDGVLVDSERVTCEVMATALGEVGLAKTTDECMRDYIGMWWPDVVALVEAELGSELPAGFTDEYRRRQNEALAARCEPVPGALAALERVEAAGAATCVASNGPHSKMEVTLASCGLAERFAGRIFSAAEVDRGKPAPDLFLHAAAALGHESATCAVVEDSALGIEAARAAGMAAFGFGPAASDAPGSTGFDSMAQLPALLERGSAGH